MPTKTPVKKTARKSPQAVKKTGKKPAKKITWDDIEAGFDRLQKSQDEAWAVINGINKYASIVEHILTPGLHQKFKSLGYSFNRVTFYKFAEGVWAQVDGMLENGNLAVVVEVKTSLRETDIDNHLARMEKIRKFADENGDKRKFMGTMASTITDYSNRNYALKKGLFVIEPSGDDVKVTMPEEKPRVW